MKKIFSLLIVALMATTSLFADDINLQQALEIANQFASSPSTQKLSKRKAPRAAIAPKLVHAMKSKVADKDNVYVINIGNNQGFVIISGESGTNCEILGYCDHGSFSYDDCPIQLKDQLAFYNEAIDSLRQNPALSVKRRVSTTYSDDIGTIIVGPLLTTTWNQWGPYNNLCPKGCPTGCVPTAVAQIMNYWRWPDVARETVNGEDFSSHVYDWDNMLDNYETTSYNAEQAKAVAQLMADVGKALGTHYGPEGSGTATDFMPLVYNFKYERSFKAYGENLEEVMKAELNENRPMLYTASDIAENGHELVVDGYTSNDYFHFNYGWGGSYDGFYKSAPIYYLGPSVITGIKPSDTDIQDIDGLKYMLYKNGTAAIIEYLSGGMGAENGEITIPSTVQHKGTSYKVTRIYQRAFYQKGHFTKMVLGDNIEAIDAFAFIYSTIDELVLSDQMKVVPDEAFQVAGIKKLTIGASIERIGNKAFYLCPLTEVVCKSPAFEVGDRAFSQSGGVVSGEWIGHITKIGRESFSNCNFKGDVNFALLEEIGPRAFAGCSFPSEKFVIPPKLKSIEPDAFWGTPLSFFQVHDNPHFLCSPNIQEFLCNSNGTSMLMTVNRRRFGLDLPETVVKFEPRSIRNVDITIPGRIIEMEGAYQDVTSLSVLRCEAVIPPEISDNSFNESIFARDPVLYVPRGSAELYRNAPGWRRFERIYDELEYTPMPDQGRQYYMVVQSTDEEKEQRVNIPISEISSMELADDGQHLIIKRQGKDNLITSTAAVDSIIWEPGFIYEDAEIFDLNDSTLTVEAQKCTVTFDPTCIDSDVQLCVRNSVLKPKVIDGVVDGFVVDLSLSNGQHELTGTAQITISVPTTPGRDVCAAYYNEESGEWEPVYFEHDETAGTVTITTSHLSPYGFFEIVEEATCGATLRLYKEIPRIQPLNDVAQKVLTIVASVDPDWEMKWDAKNEMGYWQSLGLDVIFSAANGSLEAIKGYKPFAEEVENAVGVMGYLATALNVLDVARADLKGDDIGVAAGTLKTILGHYSGIAGQFIGTTAFSVSMAGVAAIGIALDKFGTMVQQRVVDLYRKAYELYYDDIGRRSAKDWYNIFYPVISNPDKTAGQLDAYFEAVVRNYCDQFWTMDYEKRAYYVAKAEATGLSSFFEPSAAAQKQISDEYFSELMNGILVSVIQAIRNRLKVEAYNRYALYAEDMAKLVNTKIGLRIVDKSCKKDEKSKYAGWTIKFSYIPQSLKDPKTLETTLDNKGCSTIGPFTKYALIVHDIPTRLTLINPKGKEVADYPFTVSAKKGKQIITIDLSTGGEDIESPHLKGLELKYDPDRLMLPMTIFGFDYFTNGASGEPYKEEWSSPTEIPLPLDNSYNNKANFQEEVEKYLHRHEYISVDEYGNVKLGDDILTKFEGDEAKAKFTINTTHKFYERSVAEFVKGVNTFFDKDGDASNYFNLLDGTIAHKIDCEVVVTRNADGEGYDVVYTGKGTFDFNGRNVALIENYNWPAFKANENQKLTVDDISTATTQAEGTVTLKYSTTLEEK